MFLPFALLFSQPGIFLLLQGCRLKEQSTLKSLLFMLLAPRRARLKANLMERCLLLNFSLDIPVT